MWIFTSEIWVCVVFQAKDSFLTWIVFDHSFFSYILSLVNFLHKMTVRLLYVRVNQWPLKSFVRASPRLTCRYHSHGPQSAIWVSFLNGCYPLDPPYIQPPHNVTIKYTFWLVVLKQDERNGPVVLRVNHLACVTSDAAYLKATNIAILGRR